MHDLQLLKLLAIISSRPGCYDGTNQTPVPILIAPSRYEIDFFQFSHVNCFSRWCSRCCDAVMVSLLLVWALGRIEWWKKIVFYMLEPMRKRYSWHSGHSYQRIPCRKYYLSHRTTYALKVSSVSVNVGQIQTVNYRNGRKSKTVFWLFGIFSQRPVVPMSTFIRFPSNWDETEMRAFFLFLFITRRFVSFVVVSSPSSSFSVRHTEMK